MSLQDTDVYAEMSGAEEQEPTSTFNEAARFGKHRLCFELAAGGMGKVYLARTEGPGGFEKLVALKCIHPKFAHERRFVKMFLDEARIASRIQHPNVCTVFDFGEANDTYYIAMEYLVGEPLVRVTRAVARSNLHSVSPMWPFFAAKIIADACEGLHAAHELRDAKGEELRVIHRDVSPQNLFVTYEGHVSVVDFGIASATDRLHATLTGEVKGKAAYMAPEQFAHRPIDRRTDVWSLGVVLWEMLTLQRLFHRSAPADSILAVLHDPIAPPSSLKTGIPPELDAVVLRALARSPDKRYASARDFGRDLLECLRQHGKIVGLADVAEWMGSLFPDGRARKMRLVETARHAEEMKDRDAGASLGTTHVETPRDRDTSGDSATQSEATVVDSDYTLASSATESDRGRRTTHGNRAAQWVIGIALVCAAVALVYLVVIDDAEPLTAARRGELSRPPPAQPSTRRAQPSTQTVEARKVEPSSTEPRIADPLPTESPAAEPRTAEPRAMGSARAANGAPVAPRGTGTVALAVRSGWATVFHRGRKVGQTPIQLTLPAGAQRLILRHEGGEKTVLVRVRPNDVERVVVQLGD